MATKVQLTAFVRAMSIVMFFITFFTTYIFFGADLVDALLRGIITLVTSTFVLNLIVIVWKFAYTETEWKLIVDGMPKFENSEEEKSEKFVPKNADLGA
ncbi:MAG: hypothetical protein CSB55_03190 [Candidatus Cloacimonadota bacterium]|nr:MAG: hypothetical protein CSB55_03190 [Candidatus Cloacimonadota bacterium]